MCKQLLPPETVCNDCNNWLFQVLQVGGWSMERGVGEMGQTMRVDVINVVQDYDIYKWICVWLYSLWMVECVVLQWVVLDDRWWRLLDDGMGLEEETMLEFYVTNQGKTNRIEKGDRKQCWNVFVTTCCKIVWLIGCMTNGFYESIRDDGRLLRNEKGITHHYHCI